ncbi:MAG: substrate-binding domain-containing protein, partial [Chloroflexota bacterium]
MKNKPNPKLQNKKDTPAGRPTIGLLCDRLINQYSSNMWRGVADAARAGGANLIHFAGGVLHHEHHDESQTNLVYDLVTPARFDGLVGWGSQIGRFSGVEQVIERYTSYQPARIVNIGMPLEGIPSLIVESYAGMHAVVNHLIEAHNLRRIAFICGPDGNQSSVDRYQAYEDALKKHDIPIDAQLVVTGAQIAAYAAEHPQVENDVVGIHILLDERKLQPRSGFEALVANSDGIALVSLRTLHARGIAVPEDVALAGFDDMEASRYVIPPLTTVRVVTRTMARQPIYNLGWQGAETLLAYLRGEEVPAVESLPLKVMIRQSCGCQDPLLGQVMGAPALAPDDNRPFEEAFPSRRKVIAAAMTQAIEVSTPDAPRAVEKVLDGFCHELTGKAAGNFLSVLDASLRTVVEANGNVDTWHTAISRLREHSLACLGNEAARLAQAESLWQQARIVISGMAQRAQAYQALQKELHDHLVQEIGATLSTSFDLAELLHTLTQRLPSLGIPGCYLALYENPQPIEPDRPQPAPEWARLILAYDENGPIDLEEGGRRFRSREILPETLWPHDKPFCFTLQPLYFQKNPLGFVLFADGVRDGMIYETLRTQISNALQGALLVQRVEERSAELTRQNYILDTFMENVPDRIYFKDRESRFTHVNKAYLDRLGFSDYAQIDGKSDFDFFPEAQARVKFEQEQQIIKTGQPILNLEEPDGEGFWAMATKMPLRNERGEIVGTFGISRDITELVKAKRAAEAAKDEALQAQKAALAAKEEAEQARRDTEAANATLAAQIWQTAGQAQLNEKMRGEQDIATLADNVIDQLCQYLDASIGALYTLEDTQLKLAGTYAYRRKNRVETFEIGEGLAGQAAKKKRLISMELPEDYLRIASSSLGEVRPRHVVFAPLVYDNQVVGVTEMGTLTHFTEQQLAFLNKAIESIAIAFMTAQARARVNELFAQTRQQAEELQAQEEELRATNEELEAQTESLRASEERLKQNQAALEAANADLEEKTHILQEQQAELDRQNQVLRDAQAELQRRAEELALASKYKSEFLANMSHELRTPLNSMLILAGMLAKNEGGNLSADQVESAEVIHSGGTDLLNLINEILDLAKVEAGKMEFHFAPMDWDVLLGRMRAQFDPLAQRK